MNRISLGKSLLSWSGSWVAFVTALAAMAAFWYGCYWLVVTYIPEYLYYFHWGAYIAGGLALLMLIFNEPLVVLSLRARRVVKPYGLGCEIKLMDAVADVTRGALFKPRVYILPDNGMNAISFGWGLPLMSAVGATEGLIRNLNDEELRAVMAHEVGHIYNRDILVSTAMAATVMVMAVTGWLILRLGPYSGSGRSSSSSKSSGGGCLALLVLLSIGVVMYVVGRILGVILCAFVSRQREYAADTTSARIMHTGEPLISALEKVTRNPSIGNPAAAAFVGFLCTGDPEPADAIATHPRLHERIEHLRYLAQ